MRGVCSVPGDVPHSRLQRSVSAHPAIIYPGRGESERTKGCNSSPRLKPGAFLHPLNPGSVIGLRNILVHAYFRVDPDEVWAVVDHDIPALRAEVVALLSLLGGTEDAG
ncbi:DUF86 domain-containing protein [Methanoculleus sp.]|uniref:HepT-like ribonuclease domain-containing protein n=1 Tax=Methanoculleus sp. TaxID=90427 RepID=UPI0025D7B374|nr:DUF86 domain-containing protein [Methanoculleus sp.]